MSDEWQTIRVLHKYNGDIRVLEGKNGYYIEFEHTLTTSDYSADIMHKVTAIPIPPHETLPISRKRAETIGKQYYDKHLAWNPK